MNNMCHERYPDTDRTVGELEQELADNAVVSPARQREILDDSNDSELLRALATDIEMPDSGYAFGAETAARLRAIARKLALKPLSRAQLASFLGSLAFTLAAGADDLDLGARFDDERQYVALAAQLPKFLDTLRTAGSDGVDTDGER